VTTLRSSRAASAGVSAAPQLEQNLASSAFSLPQFGHARIGRVYDG
jgi:hypothetical protein